MSLIRKANEILGTNFTNAKLVKRKDETLTLNYIQALNERTVLCFALGIYYMVQDNRAYRLK